MGAAVGIGSDTRKFKLMAVTTRKHDNIIGDHPNRSADVYVYILDICLWETRFLRHEHPSSSLLTHQSSRGRRPQDPRWLLRESPDGPGRQPFCEAIIDDFAVLHETRAAESIPNP
jgi:hypothetical protein